MKLKDAVVPFHIKDTPTLDLCIQGLKRIGIERIFLISAEKPVDEVYFINENELKDIFPLKSLKGMTERAGWLFQQLLKLGADQWIPDLQDDYLICDSDIIFVSNPYEDVEDGKFPYDKAYTGEYHLPYRLNYQRLMKEEPEAGFSFINHNMVFKKKFVRELKSHIEKANKIRWDLAILQNTDLTALSDFSEYDLYGNWVTKYKGYAAQRTHMRIADIDRVPVEQDLETCRKERIQILSAQAWVRESKSSRNELD